MIHEAHGFEQYLLGNVFRKEEEKVLKISKAISNNDISLNANVVKSHTNYKVRTCDDGKLKMKARIATHGNKDNLKTLLSI